MRFSMKSVSNMAMAMAVGGLFALGACDQSKAELDQTKQQLATVTADRDSMKGQMDGLKTQLDSANKELADARSKMAEMQAQAQTAGAAVPPTVQESTKSVSTHHTSSKGSTATGAPVPAGAPKTMKEIDTQVQQKANTGASHFNR